MFFVRGFWARWFWRLGVVLLGFCPDRPLGVCWVVLLLALSAFRARGFWRVFGTGLCFSARTVPLGFVGLCCAFLFPLFGLRVLARLWGRACFVGLGWSRWVFCPDRPRGVCLCGSVGADEVAADSGGVPGGEAGGDCQVVVRILASVRADGGDLSLQDVGVRQFSVHPE